TSIRLHDLCTIVVHRPVLCSVVNARHSAEPDSQPGGRSFAGTVKVLLRMITGSLCGAVPNPAASISTERLAYAGLTQGRAPVFAKMPPAAGVVAAAAQTRLHQKQSIKFDRLRNRRVN